VLLIPVIPTTMRWQGTCRREAPAPFVLLKGTIVVLNTVEMLYDTHTAHVLTPRKFVRSCNYFEYLVVFLFLFSQHQREKMVPSRWFNITLSDF
jgi:hypothetical protein